MTKSYNITMLGTGLIGMFYTQALHGQRSRDRVVSVYSRRAERASGFAQEYGIPHHTTDLAAAINHSDSDVVVIGLPNNQHEEAVRLCCEAGKAVLCTKPLGRNAAEAKRMLEMVEQTGIFQRAKIFTVDPDQIDAAATIFAGSFLIQDLVDGIGRVFQRHAIQGEIVLLQ